MLGSKDIIQLVSNGAMGLVLALVLIKVFGKILMRFFDNLVEQMRDQGKEQVDELRELRSTVQESGERNVDAIMSMTDRVSRIEGKIEGIAMHQAPEMADRTDRTPVHGVPYNEREWSERSEPTPTETPESIRRARGPIGTLRPATQPGGPTIGGRYSNPHKTPPKRG